MPNNVFANTPHAGTALQTVQFSSIPAITQASIARITKVGNPYKSYTPGAGINAITSFVAGEGYTINPKQDLDLSAYITPPLPGVTINAILMEDGSPMEME